MKISKKDLRKIILESMTEEQEVGGSEEVPAYLMNKLSSLGADTLEKVNSYVDSAMGAESDKSDDAAASGEESEEAPAEKSGSKKIKRSEKTAYIQGVIGAPSAKGRDKGDGQWGKKTSDAWAEWVKKPENKKAFAVLVKKKEGNKESNESRDLSELFLKIISEQSSEPAPESGIALPDDLLELIDSGEAGPVADYFGLGNNLTGVEQLVKNLEAVEVPEEVEDADQTSNDADVVETEGGFEPEESLELTGGLRISFKRFQQTKDKRPVTPAREGRVVPIKITDGLKLPAPISNNEGSELKTFRRMFFVAKSGDTPGYILIKKAGKNYKLSPFKREGDLVVQDSAEEKSVVPESLSRGSLIRKRYWGRY